MAKGKEKDTRYLIYFSATNANRQKVAPLMMKYNPVMIDGDINVHVLRSVFDEAELGVDLRKMEAVATEIFAIRFEADSMVEIAKGGHGISVAFDFHRGHPRNRKKN